jgi:hypothetical protein
VQGGDSTHSHIQSRVLLNRKCAPPLPLAEKGILDNLILGRGCQNEEEKERKYERERKTVKLKLKV